MGIQINIKNQEARALLDEIVVRTGETATAAVTAALRKRLNEIYVRHTGQPIEAIERKLERDTYMSAEESRDFGLVDEVVENRPTLEDAARG